MNRNEFFDTNDRVIEPVKIQMGDRTVTLHVRSLTGAERDEYEASCLTRNQKGAFEVRMKNLRARLVEMATCNADGTAYFEQGDAARIGKKNARIIAALYEAAARLSGLGDKELEELAGESSADPSSDSPSA